MRRTTIAAALLIAVMMPAFLPAHEGHKVMGTVTVVDADHLEVKDKEGKKVSITLTSATTYLRPGVSAGAKPQAASQADVKVGQRVVVAVAEEGEKMTAKEVVLGAVEKAHPPSQAPQH
jgi:hypothetical protein